MKILKRFLSRGAGDNDLAPPPPTGTRLLSSPPSSTKGKSLSTPKSLTTNPVVTADSKRKQDKRQQKKIQQFLNSNSLARRTWEDGKHSNSAPFTIASAPTVATESSSSSSINSMTEEDEMNVSAPALLEEQQVSPIVAAALDQSSKNDNEDDTDGVVPEDKASMSSSSLLQSSSPTKMKSQRRRRRKLISWDASVEIDQSKRELTRQFRSTLPEWKQRQMAHRVHHCNARKAGKEESTDKEKEQPVAAAERAAPWQPQEIAVTPAAEGWFERCDRDISAEYLQNIDLVFANKKKPKTSSKKISSGKSVDFFATTTPKAYSATGNRSVASF